MVMERMEMMPAFSIFSATLVTWSEEGSCMLYPESFLAVASPSPAL